MAYTEGATGFLIGRTKGFIQIPSKFVSNSQAIIEYNQSEGWTLKNGEGANRIGIGNFMSIRRQEQGGPVKLKIEPNVTKVMLCKTVYSFEPQY